MLGALIAAIDELAVTDPRVLADRDTVVELHRQYDRFVAVLTRAAGSFDADGEWEADGARSAAAWLSVRCHLPKPEVKAELAQARSLRQLPAAEAAWLAGDIGAAHLQILARHRRPATEARMAEDESMLVSQAKAMPYSDFAKVVAYWAQHADPDGADRAGDGDRAARRFHLSQSIDGLWFADGTWDAIAGTIQSNELSRLETEFFHADWAEARARLGHDPTAAELDRSPAQRRADALVEMAIRSRTAPADGRRPEPLFTILLGWETLKGRMCELANGTVIAPGALLPWLDSARLERVVFDSPSRVIDVGVTRRLFAGATRRAVEVRDRQCFHEFCDTTADQCQVDHIIPHSMGGPTTQDNGRLACDDHNRARHNKPGPDP